MKIIDHSALQPGDILLTTSPHIDSKLVRFGTKSDISHAMLYLASTSVMDSTGDGVHSRNLQKMLYEDSCEIYALRPKTPLAPKALSIVIAYARIANGTSYSLVEAVRSVTTQTRAGSRKQFCSRLVARAYSAAGIDLVENPDFCTPQDLKDSPLLQILESPAVYLSEEDAAEIEAQPKGVDGMISVTNAFLAQAREMSRDILGIEDAFVFIRVNRWFDQRFTVALKTSGYLDYWRTEHERFPWRYDFAAMQEFVEDTALELAMDNYCLETLKDDEAGVFAHWIQSLQALKSMPRQFPSKTYGAMLELYENLVLSHQTRVAVALQWLGRHNGIESVD